MSVVWYRLDKIDLYLVEMNIFWMFFRLIELVNLLVDFED